MISYNSENVKFPNIKRRETTAWIRRVAATYGKKVGEVGYLFCDDEHILAVNREYLQHDYYTDIITFDYCEECRTLPQRLRRRAASCHHPWHPAPLWAERQRAW